MRNRLQSVLPGFGVSLGVTCTYLSLMVLLPLATVFARSAELTGEQFWNTVTDPRVVASYRVTLSASFVAALLNTVFGLLVAYVLAGVRPEDGKTLNAVLFEQVTAGWPRAWLSPGRPYAHFSFSFDTSAAVTPPLAA